MSNSAKTVTYIRPADSSRLEAVYIGSKAEATQHAGDLPVDVTLEMVYLQNLEIMKQLAYLAKK